MGGWAANGDCQSANRHISALPRTNAKASLTAPVLCLLWHIEMSHATTSWIMSIVSKPMFCFFPLWLGGQKMSPWHRDMWLCTVANKHECESAISKGSSMEVKGRGQPLVVRRWFGYNRLELQRDVMRLSYSCEKIRTTGGGGGVIGWRARNPLKAAEHNRTIDNIIRNEVFVGIHNIVIQEKNVFQKVTPISVLDMEYKSAHQGEKIGPKELWASFFLH